MRVLIVDDERPARTKLRRWLEPEPDVEIVGEAASGTEAVSLIRSTSPDVVFLDIQMPRLDGFGVIDEVGLAAMPLVVFVTAYDEHALRAFEVRALDYLLKPYSAARFQTVLERTRHESARGERAARADRLALAIDQAERPGRLVRLLVQVGDRALLVPVDRIDSIEASRNDVRLRTGGESYTLRGTLAELAARLDPESFLQINRSTIVRLDAVRELQPWFHGDYRIVLRDGRVLTWSRRYRARHRGGFELARGE